MKTLLFTLFFAFFAIAATSAATTLQVELVSTSSNVIDPHMVTFNIQVRVSAIGGDAFIPKIDGFHTAIIRGSPIGMLIMANSLTTLSSPDEFYDHYRINESETHTFLHTTQVFSQTYEGLIKGDLQRIIWGDDPMNLVANESILTGYGTSFVFIQPNQSVPEPSRIFFLGLGILVLVIQRRRK